MCGAVSCEWHLRQHPPSFTYSIHSLAGTQRNMWRFEKSEKPLVAPHIRALGHACQYHNRHCCPLPRTTQGFDFLPSHTLWSPYHLQQKQHNISQSSLIDEAWKLFHNMTFKHYSEEFPEYWSSYWSAADNVESSLIPEEGLPDQSLGYADIPVFCAHPHAWLVYCYYYLSEKR